MIPELLYSSYQRYKEDTNTFITWLSQAARACGFKLAENKSEKVATPRLKGKARKEARAQAASSTDYQSGPNEERKAVHVSKYEMTSRSLIEQAEVVGNSGRAKIPVNVLKVARRAIKARKRCTNWFTETKSKDEACTQAHAHFTAVLEQALSILKPCYQNQSLSSDHQPILRRPAQTFSDDLTNRFRMLQVEDEDNDVNITAPEIAVEQEGISEKSQPEGLSEQEVWELQEEFRIQIGFIVFCFFEDLHRIQDFLKKVWKEYKDGRLDLMTCTMTTNLAFDVVRRAEEDIISQAPEMLGKPRSYEAIAMLIFSVDSFQPRENPTKKQELEGKLRITPFDEFIYLSTARTLMKFERFTAARCGFPQPVPSVRLLYLFRPDLLELPQVKKWEDEDDFLSQLLMDMSLEDELWPKVSNLTRRRKPPASDELSKGLYNLRHEGEVSTWIVLAARVLLDIRDIMGKDISRGHREQVAAGLAAFKTLDLRIDEAESLASSGKGWTREDGQHIVDLCTTLQYWTVNDVFPDLKQDFLANEVVETYIRIIPEYSPEKQEEKIADFELTGTESDLSPRLYKNLQQIGRRMVEHATDPYFLRMHNPLASGTMMFNILLDMEYAGIALANIQQAIFAAAHLYNAARQTRTLEVPWPEMDQLIQAQIVELFSGELPREPREFHNRAALHLGYPAQYFARNKRKDHIPPIMKRSKMQTTPTSKILHDYIKGKEPMARCVHQLQRLIQDAECDPGTKSDQRKLAERQLSSVEVLSQIENWLSQTIPLMGLDYIRLTWVCKKLLDTIRSRNLRELRFSGEVYVDGQSRPYGILAMTLHILDEVDKTHRERKEAFKRRSSDLLVADDPLLNVCARVFREYLAGSSGGSAARS